MIRQTKKCAFEGASSHQAVASPTVGLRPQSVRSVAGSSLPRLLCFLVASALPFLFLDVVEAQEAQEPALRTLELSLQEAVELALQHNLQVKISALNPSLAEESIRSARGLFDPQLQLNAPQTFNRQTQSSASQLGGADVLTSEFVQGGFVLSEQTTLGTQWNFSGSASRQITNNQFSTFNPQYNSSLRLQITQPLLRNLDRGVNKRAILVAQNNFSVGREQFRQQLEQTTSQVVQAYWNLVFQRRSVEIQLRNLELAREQLRRNNTMVRIGVLAQTVVIQADQSVASAELSVIQAEIALANQQDFLKSLLNLDAFVPEGWAVELTPTDEPVTDAPAINVDAAVSEALVKNPIVQQARLNSESRKIDLKAARNQLLPQLNLVGSMQINGLGGDQIFRSGAFGGDVAEIQQGGLSDSLIQLLSGDFRNWSVGLQLNIPINNNFAKGQHAQASIRERQALTQIAANERQVRLAVQQAARNVAGGAQAVVAARNALRLADQQYEAEVRRFQNGISTTFQVLNFQTQLVFAQLRELGSLISLNNAIAQFEQSTGTLLERFGISIDDAGRGRGSVATTAPPPPRSDDGSDGSS